MPDHSGKIDVGVDTAGPDPADDERLVSLHDSPSMQQLVEAVREWMERDVLGATTGRVQFHTRVAINALAMVERELQFGPSQRDQHRERLTSLGFADDTELAAAIRRGELDDDIDRVVAVVRADVDAKLAVANPGYFVAEN